MSARHLALVGPTASGKTGFAVELARQLGNLELLSADAYSVYRDLDIGTAKPTAAERDGVSWHLLDLVDADVEFSVAAYREAAEEAVASVERRSRRVLFVGGTGLYLRTVIDALQPPGQYPAVRASLEAIAAEPGGTVALHRRLAGLDPLGSSRMEPSNTRRIVRALEVTIGSGRPFSSFGPGLGTYGPSRFVQIGLRPSRAALEGRIVARLDRQLDGGFVEEVAGLLNRPGGMSRTARQALGYRELAAYLDGSCSLDEARREIVRRTRSFARRQEAWFARDPRITWLDPDADDVLGAMLRLCSQVVT